MIWRLLLLAPLAIILVLFGLSNRQEVDLTLWPFDLVWPAPLSVAVLLMAGLAFIFGALIAWLSSLPWLRRARRAEQSSRQLQAELDTLKAEKAKQARQNGGIPLAPPVLR